MVQIISVSTLFVLLLSGCAGLTSNMDPPKVSLESLRNIPGQNGSPRFEITLRVVNPNKQDLDVAGISYSIDVLGKELVTGVTNNVPLIEGYGEQLVTLDVGLQLFQVLRLLATLGTERSDTVDYKFSAKVDFNGFVPTQRIEETGEFMLN